MAKITNVMIAKAYENARNYYSGELSKEDAIKELSSQYGMNPGSATDYVNTYCHIRKGEKYTRTINEDATDYYLNKIYTQDGLDELKKAINSVKQHLQYYESLDHGKLPGIRVIIEKYINIVQSH